MATMNKEVKTSIIPDHICSCCKTKLDRATGDGDPAPGSITICIGCGSILEFQEDLMLQPVSEEKMKHLMKNQPEDYIRVKLVQVAKE